MGRPEKPVDRTIPQLGKLADFLRDFKSKSGHTYEDMAKHTRYSSATLKRAASGKSLPQEDVVGVYIEICARNFWWSVEDVTAWKLHGKKLWRTAKHAVKNPKQSLPRPRPEYVCDEAGLSRALRDLHAWAGHPSALKMEKHAGGFGRLPHSTVHRIVRAETLPASENQLIAFLEACELATDEQQREWLIAWRKAMAHRSERVQLSERRKYRKNHDFEQPFNNFGPQVGHVGLLTGNRSLSPSYRNLDVVRTREEIANARKARLQASARRRVGDRVTPTPTRSAEPSL
jgi:hypothetical protein